MTDKSKLEYTLTMLKVFDHILDILIEEAENECYEKSFIEWFKEMKEDIKDWKEVVE